jgi:hypothetical protein
VGGGRCANERSVKASGKKEEEERRKRTGRRRKRAMMMMMMMMMMMTRHCPWRTGGNMKHQGKVGEGRSTMSAGSFMAPMRVLMSSSVMPLNCEGAAPMAM